MTYYNTTHLRGQQLARYESQAARQGDIVAEFFRRNPGIDAAPHEVHEVLGLSGAPLTSIRRAMTNLTKVGILEKTDNKVDGPYGKPAYTWRLKVQRLPS